MTDKQACNMDMSVLLVDDQLDNLALFSELFAQFGLNVATANNGEQAVEVALQGDFDAIFMDIQMPVMDGVHAIKLLRSLGMTTTAIALTANDSADDIARYYTAGFDGYLAKPFKQAELALLLQQHVNPNCDLVVDLEIDIAPFQSQYLPQFEAAVCELKQALNTRNTKKIRMLAHDIKGSTRTFGMPTVANIAEKIEVAVANEAWDELAELIDLLVEIAG